MSFVLFRLITKIRSESQMSKKIWGTFACSLSVDKVT